MVVTYQVYNVDTNKNAITENGIIILLLQNYVYSVYRKTCYKYAYRYMLYVIVTFVFQYYIYCIVCIAIHVLSALQLNLLQLLYSSIMYSAVLLIHVMSEPTEMFCNLL